MSPAHAWRPILGVTFFLVPLVVPLQAQEELPEVDASTIWTAAVQRGDLTLEVRGPGSLEPFGDGMRAHVRIAAIHAQDLQLDQKATVDTRREQVEARVVDVDRRVEKGTVRAVLELTDEVPEGLPAGLAIDVRIAVGHLEDVLYVDRPAYAMPEQTTGIFKVTEDGVWADRVAVEWGPVSVDKIVVAGGLEAGDTVILSDMSRYAVDRVRIVG